MKIAFIGGRDIHKLGGIENYMYNLATQLVKMGHEPIVFCESDHNGEEWLNGFRVIHMKSPKSRFICKPWLGFKATLKVMRHFPGTDIIHYNAGGPATGGAWLARLLRKPELMEGHGLEWQRSKYSGWQQKLVKKIETSAARNSQFLIMCSDVQTEYYKEQYGKIAVTIPTAINPPDMTRVVKSNILERFGIKEGKYFLFLARLVQEKNPHYLIQAFDKAKDNGFQLVVAGNNPSDPQFVEELHELSANNPDIIFTDAVYGDDKEMLLRNAFAFCVPSTIEGLSISLLEGMAYELPIIASTIPANKEVLEEDKAFWCMPEDVDSLAKAIEESTADLDSIKNMIAHNKKVVMDSYTWSKVANKYIDTLNQFLNKNNHGN